MKKLLLKILSKFAYDKRAFQYHGQKCVKCGRVLTSKESKESGMGEVCRKKAGLVALANVGMEDIHGSIR